MTDETVKNITKNYDEYKDADTLPKLLEILKKECKRVGAPGVTMSLD